MTSPNQESVADGSPEGLIFLPGSQAEELTKELVEICMKLGRAILFDRSGVPKIDREPDKVTDEQADHASGQRFELYTALMQCRELGSLALSQSV